MRLKVALVASLLVVTVGVLVALLDRGARMAGTSFVRQLHFSVVVPPGETACQPRTHLADDAASAVLLVGTYGSPRPPLSVAFTKDDGTVLARGRLGGGSRQGDVTVPFARVVEGNHSATACVRNEGSTRVALGGDIASPENTARIKGSPAGGVVGFRYLREGQESWLELAPVVAQRFGLGKTAAFGTWTLPLVALVVLGLWVAVVRLLLAQGRS